jgi:glutamyl endopeptidase
MSKHQEACSENDCDDEREEQTSATNDNDSYDDVSNEEGGEGNGNAGVLRAEDEGDVEDGAEIETHGGGTLESVPGFDVNRSMTEGFTSQFVEVEEELASIKPSCQYEFETPESVCGRDDRSRIRATTRIPRRMICQLIITRNDGLTSRCTGWFIGPKCVMTAGHCVFSHSAGGWAKKIEVIPGMDASSRPFGSLTGTKFRSVKGWTQDQKVTHDYGAIILPNGSLGNKVGWFGFANLTDASLKNLLINNSGYPGDKPFATQWFNAGRITKVTSKRLEYMLDTAGGQSGSPTWRYKDGKRHAVGIHAYGGCPNKSTRINKSVYDNMKKWKAL